MLYAIKRMEGDYIRLIMGAPPAAVDMLAEATKFTSLSEVLAKAVHAGAWAQYFHADYVHRSGGSTWFIIEIEEHAPKPAYAEKRVL